MKVFSNFTEAYYDLLLNVYDDPDFSSAPRGQRIKEKLGVSFRITNPRDRLPYIPARDFSAAYYVAEALWYLSGSDSTEWISNYSSFWKSISDDGKTANSAYGARIFAPHERIAASIDPHWTQWQYVIDELKSDPDSRRAVIHIRTPQDSILAKKDVPCTLSLQFFLRNEKLHMVTSMRSSDLILGIAYDVPAFTLFQELLANQLSSVLNKKIGLGDYTHISNSLHIYERHFNMAKDILSMKPTLSSEMPELPSLPPIKDLLEFESKCRTAQTAADLHALLKLPLNLSYWNDWRLILASHRASKLAEPTAQKEFLSATAFGGYSFFNK